MEYRRTTPLLPTVTTNYTVIEDVVAPVFHEYVVAPVAIKLAELPEQIVAFDIATVGVELTVTDTVFVFEHPFDVPVTV